MSSPVTSPIAVQYLRSRVGPVCVALIADSATALLDKASETSREVPFVEFRFDHLEKPQLAIGRLKDFMAAHPLLTAIATCRRKIAGGEYAGSPTEELDQLIAAARGGCQIVDISIETTEQLKKGSLQKLREAGAAVMISFHDFKGTPNLDEVYERMQAYEPDFYKIVPTARTLKDVTKVFDLLEKHAEAQNVIAIAMGSCGILSRLLATRFGSLFTYGSASVGEETAPGQIAARTMNELYRVDLIEAATRVYGVAGFPVQHSMSPLMLNTAFRRETVNAVYMALETSNIKDLTALIDRVPIHGFSVTMPLKEQVLPLLERTDPLSAKIGAVNTVIRSQDGKLYGFNTDVGGIVGPLERRIILRTAKVLVLGAGGAARAAVFGLRDKGTEVYILNRTPEKAQKLARQSGAKVMRRDQLSKTRFDIIINATPFGMTGQKMPSPLAADEMNCGLFFDLVYNPIETPLIRLARSKNIPIVLGVEMFVYQGARQFEIWTGKPAPQEEMLRVVLHALRQQALEAGTPVEVAPAIPASRTEGSASAAKAAPASPAPAKAVAKPAPIKPALAKVVAQPAAQSPAQSPAQSARKVIAKPAAKPAPKPAAKPVAKPAPKPVAKKAVPKPAPAKKVAPAKKAPARPVAKKTAAKPAAKKPVAKKAAPKKPAKRR